MKTHNVSLKVPVFIQYKTQSLYLNLKFDNILFKNTCLSRIEINAQYLFQIKHNVIWGCSSKIRIEVSYDGNKMCQNKNI